MKTTIGALKSFIRETIEELDNKGDDEPSLSEKEEMKDDPCWKGYEMVGMKKKGGRTVPNCVPVAKKKKK
jgi:hypothetical protein